MKKKHLFITLALVLSFTGLKAQTVFLGDANGDGKIDIADVTVTTSIILGKTTAKEVATAESVIRSNSISGTFGDKTYMGGYEYVDLGLPSGNLWATCNVGATSPEEYGLYFAWGETTGYALSDSHTFDWANYAWGKTSTTITKYCTNSSYGTVDNKTTLESVDDAATANFGGSWRMATAKEWQELMNAYNCTCEWTTLNGVNGYKVTSKKNGQSIFLPAAGYRYTNSESGQGTFGRYWSSSLSSDSQMATIVAFNQNSSSSSSTSYRYSGFSVRPVLSSASLKSVPTCSFSTSTKLAVGDTYQQTLTTNSNGAVIYSSSDEAVATINASTGQVTALKTGTTTITATVAATDEYQAATATYTVTVATTFSGHDYVDLGLPSGLLWATCNVGASNPEDYGDYFAWGETTAKSEYSEETYTMADWYTAMDGETVLKSKDDAATANWGGSWRMPTSDEWSELKSNCTWEHTTMDGVEGVKVTGTNNNYIFLPDAGDNDNGVELGEGEYWSSSLSNTSDSEAYRMKIFDYNGELQLTLLSSERYIGMAVRPVFSSEILNPEPTGTFSLSIAMGSTFKMPLTTNSDGYVYYSSSNTDVASVDENTGEVTADAAGEAVITAYVESDGSFKAAEFSYKLTVLPNKGDINSGYTDEQYSKKR